MTIEAINPATGGFWGDPVAVAQRGQLSIQFEPEVVVHAACRMLPDPKGQCLRFAGLALSTWFGRDREVALAPVPFERIDRIVAGCHSKNLD